MNINVVREFPFEELEKMVRSVPLLKARDVEGDKVFVYQDADISLRMVMPDELNPTTFYLLKRNLEFQRALREYLMAEHNVDPLFLEGGVELHNRDSGEYWTMIPPVVEVMEELVRFIPSEDDKYYDRSCRIKVPIINDGAHRVYLARLLGVPIRILAINGIPFEHPFYALPNPWEDVNIVTDIPKQGEKKLYRREDNYLLYRDFGVLGCGAPRKTDGK